MTMTLEELPDKQFKRMILRMVKPHNYDMNIFQEEKKGDCSLYVK